MPVADYRAVASGDLKGVVDRPAAGVLPGVARPARSASGATRALERLRALGADVRDVSLPHTELAIPTYYIIAPAEASSNLARFDGVRYGLRVEARRALRDMYERRARSGFGPEVTRRILLGTYVLSAGYYDAYYRKAQEVRALIASDFARVFDSGVDVLFTPTTPTPAFPLGAKSRSVRDVPERHLHGDGEPRGHSRRCRCRSAAWTACRSAASFSAGHFDEQRCFASAYALERALGEEAHR